jgi:transposase InsO family protein
MLRAAADPQQRASPIWRPLRCSPPCSTKADITAQSTPGTLTLHVDRGSGMRSKLVAELLVDPGINKTHRRPHVSGDNRYFESQFKTLKYRPDSPARFGSIEDAQSHCHARRSFVGTTPSTVTALSP